MSQSSFYGGRPGASFKIVKYFDGIDIPQVSGSIVYKKRYYAIRVINNVKYFLYPFVEKKGNNYNDYTWEVCELNGQTVRVVYSNDSTGTEFVDLSPAEGMIQCFKQGGATTTEVNYGEYVLIDTIKDLDDSYNPEHGMLFKRGTNFNYDAVTNPYYGGEYVGIIRGPQGIIGRDGKDGVDGKDGKDGVDGAQGPQGPRGEIGERGPQGEKGDAGGYSILAIYQTESLIPNNPPETIGENERYTGWNVLVGNIEDPNTTYYLYVYNYLTEAWVNVGPFNGGGEETNNYVICYTAGDTAAKTVNLSNYILKTGSKVIIKFEYKNTADNPTLNINNTGAKPLIVNEESAKDVITENSVFWAVYDGTNYILVGGAGSKSKNNFICTAAEWEALSEQEKEKYDLIFITDN